MDGESEKVALRIREACPDMRAFMDREVAMVGPPGTQVAPPANSILPAAARDKVAQRIREACPDMRAFMDREVATVGPPGTQVAPPANSILPAAARDVANPVGFFAKRV